MAGTFDEKVDDLISRHVALPKLTIGGDKPYHSLLPGRDPNDSLDQTMRGAGQAIMSDFRGNPRPLTNPGFDIGRSAEGAIPTGGSAIGPQLYRAFHRVATAGRPEIGPDQPLFFRGSPENASGRPDLAASHNQRGVLPLGPPGIGGDMLSNHRSLWDGPHPTALPDRTQRGAINPNNSFGNRWESTAELPNQEIDTGAIPGRERNMGDMVLSANRGPASGYSHNPRPDQMGDYEYGGKFNGKDVYFWKGNDMQTIFQNARNAITEYQRRNPNDPMVGAIETLLSSMQIEPNAASKRNLEGADAGLKQAQAGAIPSEMEERSARAKYYSRENPFTLGPGQMAFTPGEPGKPARKIAEGPAERPAAANASDKMNEFDKVQYQAAAHIAQNSIDPEQQKLAFGKMDEIERKYNKPKMNREEAYAKLKASGKYSDDQINAKLTALGM